MQLAFFGELDEHACHFVVHAHERLLLAGFVAGDKREDFLFHEFAGVDLDGELGDLAAGSLLVVPGTCEFSVHIGVHHQARFFEAGEAVPGPGTD